MKALSFITIFFVMVFITQVSCSSAKNDNQKTAETIQQSSSQAAIAADVNSATPESSLADPTEVIKKGEKIFKDKGCIVCHQLDTKMIGPSLKEISKAYAGNKENLNSFLKGDSKSIIDPAQHIIMEPQIGITKAMPDTERMAIVEYMISVK